jgi:hypothetical protein
VIDLQADAVSHESVRPGGRFPFRRGGLLLYRDADFKALVRLS